MSTQWIGAGAFDGAPVIKDESFYKEWIITDYADTALGRVEGVLDNVMKFDPLGFVKNVSVALGGSAI